MLVKAINYFGMALKMSLGVQSFSMFGALGLLAVGIFSVVYYVGLGLWALNRLGVIDLPTTDFVRLFQGENAPAEQPVVTQTAPHPEATAENIQLSSQQRNRLTMLLMQRKATVMNDGSLEPEKKQKKQQKIEKELQSLRQTATPYFLSNMDKKIIRAREPIPAEFQNINLETPMPTP